MARQGKGEEERGEGRDTMKRVQGRVQEERQVRKLARGAPSEEWSWDVSYIYFWQVCFPPNNLKNHYN